MGRIIQKPYLRSFVVIISVLVLSNCASAPKGDPETLAEFRKLNDPIEPTNRAIFSLNQGLDKLIIKPVTGFYRTITPAPAREAVHNFLENLRTPVILTNDILQGEIERAGNTVVRFVVNSTWGVLGFRDAASDFGFKYHVEDFGQTLAVWGIDEGPFLMLPVLGPSNPRDAVGKVVDYLIDPINWWATNTDNDAVSMAKTAITGIDTRDQLWDVLEDIDKNSVDPYASIRSLYRQRRMDDIRNGAEADDPPAPTLGGDFELAGPEGMERTPTNK